MITLRRVIPALCLATSLTGLGVYAATAAPAESAAPAETAPAPSADLGAGPHWHHGHRGGDLGPMGLVLHKLNLTAEQKTQIKAIFAGQKSQFEALHERAKANWQALAATAPNDPGYPALIQTEQTNAATRIALMHQAWKQVYENVLTQAQRDQIPGIAAAAQAARESRVSAWKAQHPEPLAN